MAFVKSFEDSSGNVHNQCIWIPHFVALDHSSKNARIVVLGWTSKEKYLENKNPIVGAVKEYNISGQDYFNLIVRPPSQESTLLGVVSQAIYDEFMKKDPFFDGAVDVPL